MHNGDRVSTPAGRRSCRTLRIWRILAEAPRSVVAGSRLGGNVAGALKQAVGCPGPRRRNSLCFEYISAGSTYALLQTRWRNAELTVDQDEQRPCFAIALCAERYALVGYRVRV